MLNKAEILEKNKELLKAMNAVEVRIDSFPLVLMTVDRLTNYHSELETIKEKFFHFTDLVLSYSVESLDTADPLPKNQQGEEMTFQYWNSVQADLQDRMSKHELEIRQKASTLAAHKDLTEFERQTLEPRRDSLHSKRQRRTKLNRLRRRQLMQQHYPVMMRYLLLVQSWKTLLTRCLTGQRHPEQR